MFSGNDYTVAGVCRILLGSCSSCRWCVSDEALDSVQFVAEFLLLGALGSTEGDGVLTDVKLIVLKATASCLEVAGALVDLC